MRKLSESEVVTYNQQGYLVVENVVNEETLDSLRGYIEAVAARQTPLPDQCFQVVDPSRAPGADGRGEVFGIQSPSRHDQLFRDFVNLPEVRGVAEDLLGESIELFTDQVIRKPPGCGQSSGAGTRFHQDDYYWRTSRPTINFWFAIDDADETHGGLRFIPGSHRKGLLEHEPYWDEPVLVDLPSGKAFHRWGLPAEEVELERSVSEPVKRGGCLCFATTTFHASWPNLGDTCHRAYGIAFTTREPPE